MSNFLKIILTLWVAFSPVTCLAGDFFGLNVFCGRQVPTGYPVSHVSDGYGWNMMSIHPVYGWRVADRLSVAVEGNIEVYQFQDHGQVLGTGASLIATYDILRAPRFTLFLEGGGGGGYLWDTPSDNIIGGGFVCNAKLGLGVRIPVFPRTQLLVGYRFGHESKPWWDDAGLNTHGVMVGVRF